MLPQHGKSQLVSRLFPAYLFGRRPQTRLAACSYAANLAREMNRDVQRIMAGPAYRALFPDRALLDRATENQGSGAGRRGRPLRNADRFDVPGGGFYVCAGVGGPLALWEALGIAGAGNFGGGGLTEHGEDEFEVGHVVAKVLAFEALELGILAGGQAEGSF